jgi:hypothetical protein
MRTNSATIVLAVWCTCMRCAHSDPFLSGTTHASVDDSRHLFQARGPATVPWSPELVDDFVVLQYDRHNSAVVGYQRSTGKVFAQRKPGGLDSEHNLRLDHAVLLSLSTAVAPVDGTVTHSAFHLDRARPCAVLTLAPHIEVSDVGWHPLVEMDERHRHQTWTITSGATSGARTVEITSNRDTLLSCVCTWAETRTAWHAVQGAARSNGCVPQGLRAEEGDVMGDHTARSIPLAVLDVSTRKQNRFCRELSAALVAKVLLPVSAVALAKLSKGSPATMNEQRCWLAAIAENGKQRVSASSAAGLDTVRAPRAAVLMDIKYTMKAIEVVQSMVAIVSKNAQLVAGQSALILGSRWLANATETLYDAPSAAFPDARKRELMAIRHELHAVLEAKAIDPLLLIPVNIPLVCDGPESPDLFAMLTSRTAAMTPESANTTQIGLQFAEYTRQVAMCTSKQLAALRDFVGCLATVHSDGVPRVAPHPSKSGAEARMSAVMGTASTPGDIDATLSQLETTLSVKYRRTALEMRQQLIDVSDKAVQTAVLVGDAQVQTARHLMQSFAGAMHNWESRLALHTRLSKITNSSGESHWFDFVSDTWCCAVAEPTPFVNDTRPCAGYLERLVRRTH